MAIQLASFDFLLFTCVLTGWYLGGSSGAWWGSVVSIAMTALFFGYLLCAYRGK